MAVGIWPNYTPGTKYGPCNDSCQHIDCRRLRDEAVTRPECYFGCGQRLAAGDAFVFVKDDEERSRAAHFECAERHLGGEQ